MAFPWERACRDCPATWDVQYADDDSVVSETDRICPECGSDAVELLADAQDRAELLADLPYDRADYERDLAKDKGARS